MAPAALSVGLEPRIPAQSAGVEEGGEGSRTVSEAEFVTAVTRLRALLRGVREAVHDGEIARADTLISQAQTTVAVIGRVATEDADGLN